jgi:hypothetical protein
MIPTQAFGFVSTVDGPTARGKEGVPVAGKFQKILKMKCV